MLFYKNESKEWKKPPKVAHYTFNEDNKPDFKIIDQVVIDDLVKMGFTGFQVSTSDGWIRVFRAWHFNEKVNQKLKKLRGGEDLICYDLYYGSIKRMFKNPSEEEYGNSHTAGSWICDYLSGKLYGIAYWEMTRGKDQYERHSPYEYLATTPDAPALQDALVQLRFEAAIAAQKNLIKLCDSKIKTKCKEIENLMTEIADLSKQSKKAALDLAALKDQAPSF